MTEEQRNENIIRSKIQCICQDCMYLDKIVPILNKMQNETYIDGLEQGKLDKEMDKQNIIDFLENEIKEYSKFIDDATDEILTELQRVLDFVKGGKE